MQFSATSIVAQWSVTQLFDLAYVSVLTAVFEVKQLILFQLPKHMLCVCVCVCVWMSVWVSAWTGSVE